MGAVVVAVHGWSLQFSADAIVSPDVVRVIEMSVAAAYNLYTGPAVSSVIVRAKEERVDVTALDQRFWQVRVEGEVVGYVDEIDVAGETRFRARRLRYPDGRWLLIGEWWELDSALAACADVPRSKTRVRKLVVPPQNRWR